MFAVSLFIQNKAQVLQIKKHGIVVIFIVSQL